MISRPPARRNQSAASVGSGTIRAGASKISGGHWLGPGANAPSIAMTIAAVLAVNGLSIPTLSAQVAMTIEIPDASGFHLHSPDELVSLVSFSGEASIDGTVLLRSRRQTIDDETQSQIELSFVPDAGQSDKLPRVRHPEEHAEAMYIDLDYFDHAARDRTIQTVFGEAAATQLGRHEFQLARRGRAVIADYRTGVECDRRYHYATLTSFSADAAVAGQDAQSLLQARKSPCQ